MKKEIKDIIKVFVPKRIRHRYLRRDLIKFFINFFAWILMAGLYYLGFSLFFDTPLEHRMKQNSLRLENEYEKLSSRYDTIISVLENVHDRDKSVYRMLFESDPYQKQSSLQSKTNAYDVLLTKSNKELGKEFLNKIAQLKRQVSEQENKLDTLQLKALSIKDKAMFIPDIQPIVNKDLIMLSASYGMRIHPFFKSIVAHQGVDYSTPMGTRVFATADGTVKDIQTNMQTYGLSILVSHGNGYETFYANLDKILVKKGANVKRGDIIALTGNSGLSLAPHMHYEIRHYGVRVDPQHYFFGELNHEEYAKLQEISRFGMQSLD